MDRQTNSMIFFLGVTLIVTGIYLITKNLLKIRSNNIVIGEIIDLRSGYKDHDFPIIQYQIENSTKEYESSHYSIFYKIGKKIRLVYSQRKKEIIGTLSEMFFIPVTLLLVGIFLTTVILLFYFQNQTS